MRKTCSSVSPGPLGLPIGCVLDNADSGQKHVTTTLEDPWPGSVDLTCVPVWGRTRTTMTWRDAGRMGLWARTLQHSMPSCSGPLRAGAAFSSRHGGFRRKRCSLRVIWTKALAGCSPFSVTRGPKTRNARPLKCLVQCIAVYRCQLPPPPRMYTTNSCLARHPAALSFSVAARAALGRPELVHLCDPLLELDVLAFLVAVSLVLR
jgi:hypothetical protein